MENGNKINYTNYVFKLIKQFDINLYQYLLEYYKKHNETRLSRFLFGQYKNKYEDPILEIVKRTRIWYENDELNDISKLSKNKWHLFLFGTHICFCKYNDVLLSKLNKMFWKDNILLQYIKEHNVK